MKAPLAVTDLVVFVTWLTGIPARRCIPYRSVKALDSSYSTQERVSGEVFQVLKLVIFSVWLD